jgi:hypothetical protein
MSEFLEKAMKVGKDGKIESDQVDSEWWEPEEGDVIGGPLVKGYYRGGEYGINAVMVITDVASGSTFSVSCSPKILKDAVTDLAPGVGTNVVIQYVGTFPTTKNPEWKYKSYIVRVEGDAQFGYWQDQFRAFQAKQSMQAEAVAVQRVQSFGPDTSPF